MFVQAMKKQPIQTLLMAIIILVFMLMMVQVCRRDTQVEKLGYLEKLFGSGKEDPPSNSAINSTAGNGVRQSVSWKTAVPVK
tara:strand:- start:1 stop:246 length:246 start_codon:yes stop_codon:yes gene_type:complete